ncbi:MAG: hypothetical protein HY644_06485 [Acidobacteria bacterium]|nr:hypothetical protein [Acidobacteriota bacterium]
MRLNNICWYAILGFAVSAIIFGCSSPGEKSSLPPAMEKPNLKGIAYVATEGGHIVAIDLATKKIRRIPITEAGSEMEGMVAGGTMGDVKKGGGMHGVALSPDKNKLYVGLLNGNLVAYDFATAKKSEPIKVGQKFCDLQWGPDGNLYLNDMADGNVYVWDAKVNKLVEKIPVSKALCGIQWSKDGKFAYISDMVLGIVQVMDWPNKKILKKIEIGPFIHQIHLTPDGKELWVAAANEFKDLKPHSVADKGPSEVVIIDTATNEVKDRITMGHTYAHDIDFSPDGKYALISARTYENDSALLIYDAIKREKFEANSLCIDCHQANEVRLTVANSPNLCGLTIDWEPKAIAAQPKAAPVVAGY